MNTDSGIVRTRSPSFEPSMMSISKTTRVSLTGRCIPTVLTNAVTSNSCSFVRCEQSAIVAGGSGHRDFSLLCSKGLKWVSATFTTVWMGEWMYCFFASLMRDTFVMVKARPFDSFCWSERSLLSLLKVHRIWPMQYSEGLSGEAKTQENDLPVRFLPSHWYSYSST